MYYMSSMLRLNYSCVAYAKADLFCIKHQKYKMFWYKNFFVIFGAVCWVGASYICKYSGNQSQWTNWNDWKERVSIGRQMLGFSLVSCHMIKPSHWLFQSVGAWTEVMVWWNVIATENNIIAIPIQKIQKKYLSQFGNVWDNFSPRHEIQADKHCARRIKLPEFSNE